MSKDREKIKTEKPTLLSGFRTLDYLRKKEVSSIDRKMIGMRKEHSFPAAHNPESLIDVEALALFRNFSLYEIKSFYAREEEKDREEAIVEGDKLTEHQHKIIKRAIEFHNSYNNLNIYKNNLNREIIAEEMKEEVKSINPFEQYRPVTGYPYINQILRNQGTVEESSNITLDGTESNQKTVS